jgi:pyrophosphatase PpaX
LVNQRIALAENAKFRRVQSSLATPRQFSAVIFDLDGTLLDTFPAIVKAWNAAFVPLVGSEAPADEVVSHFGLPDERMITRAFPANLNDEERNAAFERYFVAYQAAHSEIQPFAGVQELLRDLQTAQIPIGLMTGKGRRSLEITLDFFGWRSFFGNGVSGDDVEEQKPNSEGVLKVAQSLGVEAHRCAYIGDSPADIGAAQNSGMFSVVAGWHPYYTEQLRPMKPDFWPETTQELREFLLGKSE